jgi:hypothetical protein
MKAITVTVIVGILALIYLNTAVVVGEGGGGSMIVLRPFHGFAPFYGGGEEGTWRREHPNQPDPWWHTGAFTRLSSFDDEAATSPVIALYTLGYYVTVLSVVALILHSSRHHFLRKNRNA